MRRIAWTLAVVMLGMGLAGCGGVDQTALGDLEDCVNGVDDNGDGMIDCADSQCDGHAACLTMQEMSCANGADDDGDGLIDCDDPDCLETADCNPGREWSCHDGVDNDGDGLPDCLDPDCTEACGEICDDGVDNNSNGLTDCADPICAGVGPCAGGNEICNNDIDDDGDGYKDCDDPDCVGKPVCILVELCDPTGVDEDGDGFIDCADPDCAASPYCHEVNCLDGEDNDGDMAIDCDDPDCQSALTCQSNTECLPAQPLTCNTLIETSTVGRLNNLTTYPCLGSYPGPERYYQFTAQREIIFEFFLEDWDQRDLIMVATGGDPSGGCNFANNCIPEPHEVEPYLPVTVSAGATLFLTIDGGLAAPGAFDLLVACTPTDEVGLCGDGYDNDQDGWIDCEDADCASEPQCDYWLSAGWYCMDDIDCPSEEWCENVTFNGTMNTVGFCTRSCSAAGALGGECGTDNWGDGECTGNYGGQGLRCLLPCYDASDPCPSGNLCTNIISGSTSDLANGYCLPYQF